MELKIPSVVLDAKETSDESAISYLTNMSSLAGNSTSSAILVSCPFRNIGCSTPITLDQLSSHVKTCRHAPFVCPLLHCHKAYLYLIPHLQSEHRITEIVDGKFNTKMTYNIDVQRETDIEKDDIAVRRWNRMIRILGNNNEVHHFLVSVQIEISDRKMSDFHINIHKLDKDDYKYIYLVKNEHVSGSFVGRLERYQDKPKFIKITKEIVNSCQPSKYHDNMYSITFELILLKLSN